MKKEYEQPAMFIKENEPKDIICLSQKEFGDDDNF